MRYEAVRGIPFAGDRLKVHRIIQIATWIDLNQRGRV
jgi:hypothetical protein